MTLFYSIIIFLILCSNVYHDCMLSIVRLSLYSCMESYSSHLVVPWVSGKHSVSVVLIPYFPAIAPYILGRVVDRGCDNFIESYAVHPQIVGLVEPFYYGRLALFLIFLSNIHHV
jgi:hypothetical protein